MTRPLLALLSVDLVPGQGSEGLLLPFLLCIKVQRSDFSERSAEQEFPLIKRTYLRSGLESTLLLRCSIATLVIPLPTPAGDFQQSNNRPASLWALQGRRGRQAGAAAPRVRGAGRKAAVTRGSGRRCSRESAAARGQRRPLPIKRGTGPGLRTLRRRSSFEAAAAVTARFFPG